ncbi:MAG: hypothetical protein AAFQ37_05935 [Bacteroidota bacterium]
MRTKNGINRGRNGSFSHNSPREIIVADPTALTNNPTQPNCPQDKELEDDIRDFKVFMKKNLPLHHPGPDLLVKIHQRIDQVKLENE